MQGSPKRCHSAVAGKDQVWVGLYRSLLMQLSWVGIGLLLLLGCGVQQVFVAFLEFLDWSLYLCLG